MDTWREEDTISPKEKEPKVFKVNPTQGKHRAHDFRGEDEMMDSQPQAKQHDSVLNQNYQYLADNIERLYNQVENLEQRLKIILTDSEPESARDSMGYGGNTALSENLAQLCRKTQDLSDRLNYLTARIDL